MNVKEIIIEHLKKINADGLCTENCGCGIDDLFPCREDFSNCIPAKLGKCSDEKCEHDFAGECEQCFQAMDWGKV